VDDFLVKGCRLLMIALAIVHAVQASLMVFLMTVTADSEESG
jgi:hypothetical protein